MLPMSLSFGVGSRGNPSDDGPAGAEFGHCANDVPPESTVFAPPESTFELDGPSSNERPLQLFANVGTIVDMNGLEDGLGRRAIEFDARVFTPSAVAKIGCAVGM